MVAIFLQARLNSSRLPRKALLSLGDRTVVEHSMRAMESVPSDCRWLLVPENEGPEFKSFAEQSGWGLFEGSENDVLSRFASAASASSAHFIVRATADNALLSSMIARATLALAQKSGASYTAFADLPVGTGVEVLSGKALAEADAEAHTPYEREHVSPFLYRNPERFRIEKPNPPRKYRFPEGRVTLDTPEDYIFLQNLFNDLYEGDCLDLDTLIPYLKTKSHAG